MALTGHHADEKKSPVIYLAGATGYLGREFIAAHAAGNRVLPIVRSVPRLNIGPWANAIRIDDLDNVKGSSVKNASLIHLVGSGRDTAAGSIWSTNVEVTRRLVKCSDSLGVSRLVFVSGYGIDSPTTSVYYRAKHEAERLICESHVSAAVLRCSYVIGGDDELTPGLLRQARAGAIAIPGHGRFRIQPVHVGDVIEILYRLATDAREVEGVFDLIGEAVSFAQFAADVGSLTGVEFELVNVDLEDLIREAVTCEQPQLSLSELGILCADKVGEPTRELVGVKIACYHDILRRLAEDIAKTDSAEAGAR